jgi:leucyl/phenylalanyl-tRNA--protein transferase|tara:strand:- start:1507 stop:2190 length:684 start_codon:yes stop_codon:yes gene_type:complete
MALPWLTKIEDFPNPNEGDDQGLLAIGGELSSEWLLSSYKKGIFPWYNNSDPILWWSPNPRMVLIPSEFKISKSFRNTLNKHKFRISMNEDFESVLSNCALIKRQGQTDTWLTNEMQQAYVEMHKLGWAHSVEVWEKEKLVGGLYGIAFGKIFFGESMFSLVSNSSKLALHYLCEKLLSNNFELLDCQVYTSHLLSLGAKTVPRKSFLSTLEKYAKENKVDFSNLES